MKAIVLVLLASLIFSQKTISQNIYQPWVFRTEGQVIQMELEQEAKQVYFKYLIDVAAKRFAKHENPVELLTTREEAEGIRIVVNNPRTHTIGLIYCFNLGKEEMHLYLVRGLSSLEEALAYPVSKRLKLRAYTWKKVKEILALKEPDRPSKAELITILDDYLDKLREVTQGTIPDYRPPEEEMYLKNLLLEVLLEKDYNIFHKNIGLMGNEEAYRSDKKVEAQIHEIARILMGTQAFEELMKKQREALEKDKN